MNHKSSHNRLREFFHQRKIEPTQQSWDRLDAMLSVAEKSKPKKYPIHLWAAAITLVIAALISLTMIGDKPKHSSPLITHTMSPISSQTPVAEAIVTSPPVIKSAVSLPTPSSEKISQGTVSQDRKHRSINKASNAPIEKIISSLAEPISLAAVPPKKMEQTSEVEPIMASIPLVTKGIDIDAQSLLKSVEAKIAAKEKMELRRKYNIDSAALLAEAESESNKSFFNKVIKTIQETSGTVITAVNERNMAK
ncbi:MAG: hypothetical protein WBO36_02660 [Saprospiraceae bacterium]